MKDELGMLVEVGIGMSKAVVTGLLIFIVICIADRWTPIDKFMTKYTNVGIVILVLIIGLIGQLIMG